MNANDSVALAIEYLRVVVVEDDTIFRTLVLNALRNQAKSRDLALDVAAAGSLEAAQAELRRRPTDAAIVDLNLPDSNGLDTITRLVAEFPDLTVIVLTGDDDVRLAQAVSDAGAQDFLPKHFSEPLRMLELTIGAVSRKRRSQRELDSIRHEQQVQRMVALGTMTSGIVHEHNNIQTALMGNLELLARSQLDPDQRKRVERCIAAVERGNEITRSLLDFAADHSGAFERVDLRTVTEEAAESVEALATVEGVVVNLRLSQQPVSVAGNAAQLVQVIANLATNACHAMAGRAQRELRIEVMARGDEARVSVSDTGHGFDDEVRSRLFDPFFSTKRQRATDRPGAAGTGLGLSVCDSFVRHHDGRIEVESAVGHGSTFRVVLPLMEAVVASGDEPATEAIRNLNLQDREIFVIDTDKAALDRATEVLRDAGCVVTSTRSGSVALRLIEHRRPDAILARIDHSGNGELVDQLRNRHPQVPLAVIVEANANWQDDDDQVPAKAILRAPYSSKQLLATLGHLLETKLIDQG